MTKDAQGIWSVTVDPIAPDIYPYNFRVDGISVMDPANVAFFPNERFKASLVDIPGDTPLIHAMKDVPHGTITYEYYPSVGRYHGFAGRLHATGLRQESGEKIPCFLPDQRHDRYRRNLLQSREDQPDSGQSDGGRQSQTDDHRHALRQRGGPSRRANGSCQTRRPNRPRWGRCGETGQGFETDLVSNVIPYVEKNYRTEANRENRAIGGFSRGGGQTLRTAFGNMDKFAWVCAYSSYLSPQEMDGSFSHIGSQPDKTNKQLKLLWVSVGKDDFLYKGTTEFMDYLKAKKVNFKALITEGGHTWMNVKDYVARTAPILFR